MRSPSRRRAQGIRPIADWHPRHMADQGRGAYQSSVAPRDSIHVGTPRREAGRRPNFTLYMAADPAAIHLIGSGTLLPAIVAKSSTSSGPLDVSVHMAERAQLSPFAPAVIDPAGAAWRPTTYAELDSRCDDLAQGLAGIGLTLPDRVALLMPPSRDLVATVFALFRLGAIPVVADPGRGAAELARSLARVRPKALIGAPATHVLHAVHSVALPSIEISVTTGRGWLPGVPTLDSIAKTSRKRFRPFDRIAESKPHDVRPSRGRSLPSRDGSDSSEIPPDAEAAILFTSGSTGPAKGVVYTHANFQAQLESLRALYGFRDGEIDLACFPLFALFAPALGMACVFPKLDPRRPGRCDPAEIVRAANETGATTTFGSPAIWRRVVPWALARGVRLRTLRRVLVAGAPVSPSLVEGLLQILPDGAEVHTPYGQTEALPLASISGAEILARRARIEGGAGNCIGRPAPGVEIAVIRVTDEPIARWNDSLRLPPLAVGEICARGAVVTRSYADDPVATAAAKIAVDGNEPASFFSKPPCDAGTPHVADGGIVPASVLSFRHRTGDLGYFDEEGMLWFCGRKSHRLETERGLLAPVPTENLLNRHPKVARTALVGVGPRGRERPAVVVEPVTGAMPRGRADRARFAAEIAALLSERRSDSPPPAPERIEAVLFKRSFPVDARHNAKIRSEELKRWAEEKLS